jgi:hypothetical protein
MENIDFLNVTPCILVNIYKHFGGTYYPTYYSDDRGMGSSKSQLRSTWLLSDLYQLRTKRTEPTSLCTEFIPTGI